MRLTGVVALAIAAALAVLTAFLNFDVAFLFLCDIIDRWRHHARVQWTSHTQCFREYHVLFHFLSDLWYKAKVSLGPPAKV